MRTTHRWRLLSNPHPTIPRSFIVSLLGFDDRTWDKIRKTDVHPLIRTVDTKLNLVSYLLFCFGSEKTGLDPRIQRYLVVGSIARIQFGRTKYNIGLSVWYIFESMVEPWTMKNNFFVQTTISNVEFCCSTSTFVVQCWTTKFKRWTTKFNVRNCCLNDEKRFLSFKQQFQTMNNEIQR